MDEKISVEELEKRWENVLLNTNKAVAAHSHVYHEIKLLAVDIITKPLDIKDYTTTAEKLVGMLKTISCDVQGSIFQFYYDRISPSSVCNLKLFRVECQDLLSYLEAFDEWHNKKRHLQIVK